MKREDVKFTVNPGVSITVYAKGVQKSFLYDDPVFAGVYSAIRESRWNDLEKLIFPEKLIEKLSKGVIKVIDGSVHLGTDEGTVELPEELNSTVLHFVQENLPYDYLVKFALKLFQNPSKSSIKQLYKYLSKNQFPICDDGDFIAYRKVTNEFKDFRTEKFDNSIGSTVEMKRELVDDNPNVTCSSGLHAANWDYAHNFYYPGEGRIVVMKINPADVVSVPVDYNDAKMRVFKFYVLEEVKEEYSGSRAFKYESSTRVEDLPTDLQEGEDCECDGCDEGSECENDDYLDVPKHARPHTVSVFETLLSVDDDRTSSQNNLDDLATALNSSLCLRTENKNVFVVSEDTLTKFDYLSTLTKVTSREYFVSTSDFYDALQAIRSKKACPVPVVLELRVASREGKLSILNRKKFDKDYRSVLGLE